jgi:hypothetical protein
VRWKTHQHHHQDLPPQVNASSGHTIHSNSIYQQPVVLARTFREQLPRVATASRAEWRDAPSGDARVVDDDMTTRARWPADHRSLAASAWRSPRNLPGTATTGAGWPYRRKTGCRKLADEIAATGHGGPNRISRAPVMRPILNTIRRLRGHHKNARAAVSSSIMHEFGLVRPATVRDRASKLQE